MFWSRAQKRPTEIYGGLIAGPAGWSKGHGLPGDHHRLAWRWTLLPLGVLVSLGCVTSTQTPEVGDLPANNREVLAVVRLAIQLDATGEVADSLYTPFATIVADGTERTSTPRFAGVAEGGRIIISDLAGEVLPPNAWALATYRWTSNNGRIVEMGRGTFLLERVSGAWRIKHAHSSVVPPWSAQRR